MKNLKVLILSALALSALNSAWAINYEDAMAKEANKVHWSEFVRGSNTVMMNLFYLGTASEAVVNITNEHIRAFAPAGTADTGFGLANSSYSFVASSANTVGKICNLINDLTNYQCLLKAGRFNDLPVYLRDQTGATGVNDMKAAGGFDVMADTGGASAGTSTTVWERIYRKPVQGKRAIVTGCRYNINSSGLMELNVYGKERQFEGATDGVVRDSRTTVWGPVEITTGSAATTVWNAVSSGGGIEFAEDTTAVVEVVSKSSTSQVTASYLQCDGFDR